MFCLPRQHRLPYRRPSTSILAVALPKSFELFAQISSAMPCPHAQFTKDGNRFGAYEPLSTYISSSSECPECELLLRVVENYKPGWIEEKKLDDGLIYVLHRSGAVVISLLVGKPFDDGREWLADTTVVDSFSLLRHSPGTRFPLCRIVINEAEFTV